MVVATLAVFLVPLASGTDLTRRAAAGDDVHDRGLALRRGPGDDAAPAVGDRTAGRHGVLVKSAVVMERLGQVGAVALDKTGTLTEGTPRVTETAPCPAPG